MTVSQPGASRDEIVGEIKQFIRSTFMFDLDAEQRLNDDSNLFEAGVIDSYGLLELIMHIESRFGISVTEADLTSGKLVSVHGITAVVMARIPPR